MKIKCSVCKKEKARRDCKLKGDELICSRCCAEIRSSECGDCVHYIEAMRHSLERDSSLPDGHFIAEINPAVQDAVDDALELAQNGETAEAFREMERLVSENPRNHDVCYGMGTLYAIAGDDTESAIRWFKKAISIFPYMAEAHYNLGIAYQRSCKLGEMIKSIRKAVQYGDPQGECYQRAKKQLEVVTQVIGKNVGVDLDSYVISSEKFDAAFEKMENRQWADALEGFKEAAAHNEKNSPTHGNMGICLAQLGRKSEALAALDRALEIDPEYEPAIGNRLLVERMKEGASLTGDEFVSINYSAGKF